MVAVGALTLFRASGSTSRSLGLYPVAHSVTQSVDITINIGVTAVAGVGGVALVGASGSRYDGGVAVADRFDFAGLGVVAVLAILLLGSLFGASRFNRHIPVAVGVNQSIDIGVGEGITAGGTGMGSVALIGTSRSRYDGLILVLQSFDLTGLGEVAVLAVVLLGSLFGAGGFHRHIPVAVAMTQGIDIAVGVSVTTVAGMSGVTLLGTGGCGYNRFVAVTGCLNRSGLGMVAVGALTLFRASGSTSRSLGLYPVAHSVTQSVDITINIGVTAGSAGVGGVALFGASRSCNDGFVLMTKSRYLAGFRVVAVLTVMLLGSLFSASGFNHHVPVAVGVTRCINVGVGVGVAAGSAGVGGVALFDASGSRGGRLILVAGCLNLAGLGMVAVGALTLFRASGSTSRSLGLNPVAHGMTRGVDITVNIGITAMAGMSGVALVGASGRGYDGFVAMNTSIDQCDILAIVYGQYPIIFIFYGYSYVHC